MTALEQLKSMLDQRYVSEDDDEYRVELKPGLTAQQLELLRASLPGGCLPPEIHELLAFASGFEFYGIDEVTFDGIGLFGLENIFPCSIQLAGDGFGNFWILDIDEQGNWGPVFYACHDPEAIIKHSNNLAEFLRHIDEYGKFGSDSHLDVIHEKTVMQVWEDKAGGFIDKQTAQISTDISLSEFARQLPDNFVIVDLRNKPNKTGFSFSKFAPDIDNAVRYKGELLWGFEKKKRKSLLSKLFGRK
jgi:hypothetical protein